MDIKYKQRVYGHSGKKNQKQRQVVYWREYKAASEFPTTISNESVSGGGVTRVLGVKVRLRLVCFSRYFECMKDSFDLTEYNIHELILKKQ